MTEQEVFPCPHCPEAFDSYQARNAHKGQKHDTLVEVECEVCGEVEKLRPVRAENHSACSYECSGILTSRKQSGEDNPAFKSEAPTQELVSLYEQGLSSTEIADRYSITGTCVRNRLRKAGVEIQDPGFPKKVDTNAGYCVRSYYEKVVADWLDSHDVSHKYEPDGFGKWTPDFVISGDVVEVWGVKNNESYNQRRKEKEQWYEQRGIRCIGIEPQDVGNLSDMLGEYS